MLPVCAMGGVASLVRRRLSLWQLCRIHLAIYLSCPREPRNRWTRAAIVRERARAHVCNVRAPAPAVIPPRYWWCVALFIAASPLSRRRGPLHTNRPLALGGGEEGPSLLSHLREGGRRERTPVYARENFVHALRGRVLCGRATRRVRQLPREHRADFLRARDAGDKNF